MQNCTHRTPNAPKLNGEKFFHSNRVMKKGSLVCEAPEIAKEFVIPAKAGIQTLSQLIDIKVKTTGPRLSPG